MRLRSINTLAKELNKTVDECVTMLASRSIYVIDGYYDASLFEAVLSEPRLAARARIEWGLSPRLGLGAVKTLLDPLGVRVVIHNPKRCQWLMLRKGTETSYVKWQFANEFGRTDLMCTLEVRNFLEENAPLYFFTCFDGPHAWVLTPKILTKNWIALKSGEAVEDFKISRNQAANPGGALTIRLNTRSSKFALKDSKQLGFSF